MFLFTFSVVSPVVMCQYTVTSLLGMVRVPKNTRLTTTNTHPLLRLHMARGKTALKASNRQGSEIFEPGAKSRIPYILKKKIYISAVFLLVHPCLLKMMFILFQ